MIVRSVVFALVLVFLVGPAPARDLLLQAYPHWSPADRRGLEIIDRLVESRAGRGDVAVFDWDGTLVSEKWRSVLGDVRAGQSAWHAWGASHLDVLPGLFPTFETTGGLAERRLNVLRTDDVVEGRTNVKPDAYSKFTTIAAFERGMTPAEVTAGVSRFLDAADPLGYVHLPVFDVFQRMIDRGFAVWIATGSNPFFVATCLARIEKTLPGRCAARFGFGDLSRVPYTPRTRLDPRGSRIAGNMMRLGRDGRFSSVYDDRFVRSPDGRVFVVEGEGKRVAVEGFVEPLEGKRAVFVAGNSDGDHALAKAVLEREIGAVALLVNPRGTELPAMTGERVVKIAVGEGMGTACHLSR